MIRPVELRKDWGWVKPLVEAVKQKNGYDWFVEDVYGAVAYGKAAMYVNDEPEGVLVVYPDKEVWTNEPVLFVWIVYCRDGMEQMQAQTYAFLDDLKTKIGATKLVMDGRPGWQKCGWRVKRIFYER